jgi:MFS family permease
VVRPQILRPLGERDFRLLWSARSISMLGDGMFSVALVWQTLELSSSATTLATVVLCRALPRVLFMLVGGVVSDRVSRKRVLIMSDLVQGGAVAVIATSAALETLAVWHLISMAIVVGTAEAFFFPTSTAIVPHLLTEENLLQGNALNTSSRLLVMDFLGPALGGLIIAGAGSSAVAFGIDAATFALSAALLSRIRSIRAPSEPAGKVVDDLKEGFAFTRSQRWLWITLVSASVGNFMLQASVAVLIPLMAKESLGAGAAELGAVFAAIGIGGGVAALVSSQVGVPRRRILVMYGVWGVAGIFISGAGAATSIPVLTLMMGGLGFCLESGNLLWESLIQTFIPRRMLGRVSSVDWMVSLALQPVALAVAGPLAEAFGATTLLTVGGAAMAVSCTLGVTRRGVRDPEREVTLQL